MVTELILASGSPRRRELLEKLGVSFRVRVSDVNEDIAEPDPACFVETLARAKAGAIAALEPGASVIAAEIGSARCCEASWSVAGSGTRGG